MLLASSIDTSTSSDPGPGALRCPAPAARARFRGRAAHLFVAREPASFSQRSVTNEDDIRAFLTARGFEVLEPGNMSIEAQAAALAEAAVIVGAHGSALAGILFAAPRALVVDLMPADWVGYWDVDPPAERWLLNLTTALGLDYRLVLCPSRMMRILPEDDRSGRQHFAIEATVDLDLLGKALDGVSPATGAAAPEQDHTLAALTSPALEPLFRHPDRRRGSSSAWPGPRVPSPAGSCALRARVASSSSAVSTACPTSPSARPCSPSASTAPAMPWTPGRATCTLGSMMIRSGVT